MAFCFLNIGQNEQQHHITLDMVPVYSSYAKCELDRTGACREIPLLV